MCNCLVWWLQLARLNACNKSQTLIVCRSVVNSSRVYPVEVNRKVKKFASLRVNAAPLHHEDVAASEFLLLGTSISRHCDVFADTATDAQARLLQHPDVYARAALAAHPGRVHDIKPVIFIGVNIKTHDMETTVMEMDSYIRHHMLLGMQRMVAYISEKIVLLSQNSIIKVLVPKVLPNMEMQNVINIIYIFFCRIYVEGACDCQPRHQWLDLCQKTRCGIVCMLRTTMLPLQKLQRRSGFYLTV